MLICPPLNALRAFEAAARHLSFKDAAEELCVTQGAISRHISRLEEFLGQDLFVRQNRRVALTAVGTAYHNEIETAFARISRATAQIHSSLDKTTIKVQLPPTCAVRWFVPRLSHLRDCHPELSVEVMTEHGDIDFSHGGVDAAIQYGGHVQDDVVLEKIISEELVPVCSPQFANTERIARAQDLASQVLLKSSRRPSDWPRWFQMAGVPMEARQGREIFFENASLTYEAAEKGLGIALAQVAFIQDEIASGRLIVPVKKALSSRTGYYLLIPRERARLKKLRDFRNWLTGEASTNPQIAEQ